MFDEFRRLFPDHADSPWLSTLEGRTAPGSEDRVFLDVHQGVATAMTPGQVGLGLAAIREQLDRWTVAPDVILDALCHVATQVLGDQDGPGRHQGRVLVDLLLRPEVVESHVSGAATGLAYLVHVRAGDEILAGTRLASREGPMVIPANVDPAPYRASRLRGHLYLALAGRAGPDGRETLERAAQSFLENPTEDPYGRFRLDVALVLGGLQPLTMSSIVSLGGLENLGTTTIVGQIEELGAADPNRTLRVLCEAFRLLPLTGYAPAGPVVVRAAEELVWAVGDQEFRAWALSELALFLLVSQQQKESARLVGEALASLPSSPDGHGVQTLANLVQAAVRPAAVAATAVHSGSSAGQSRTSPSPRLPQGLIDLVGGGDVLLVAGGELPNLRKMPGRLHLMSMMIRETRSDLLSDGIRERALQSLTQGSDELAVRVLRSLDIDVEERIARAFRPGSDTAAYDSLGRLPVSDVVSLAWDPALLAAFSAQAPVEITPGDEATIEATQSDGLTFTWLMGDPARGAVSLSRSELQVALAADDTLARYVTGLVQSSPLLFVGARPSEIEGLLQSLAVRTITLPGQELPHFAICAADDLWELDQERLRSLYSVELVGYDPADETALGSLLEQLVTHTQRERPAVTRGESGPAHALHRVRLVNIGAFEELDVELTEGWNVLLGTNGVGKSTVLRGIALGLVGDHPRATEAGEDLLRVGADHGMIELTVGASRFRTELTRSYDRVRVTTSSLTPVQQGNWAVLGFPALRGLSLTSPTGTSSGLPSRGQVDDVLPLLFGGADRRLDDLKQWIINVDARTTELYGDRWRRMLSRFFEVVGDLTPGVTLRYRGVDRDAWDVRVGTSDGVVSIDQLSQGITSVISWVGTLIQRLYDLHPDTRDPTDRRALLLIDELDAHLHPEWQRALPGLIRKHFPNVQCVATSHSPLVVAGLEKGEVFVAQRQSDVDADGRERWTATLQVSPVDPVGLRADQILASPLFDLVTSRSPKFVQQRDRFADLLGVEDRTTEQQEEFEVLEAALAEAYRDGETAEDRHREAAEEARVDTALRNLAVDDAVDLAQIKAVFDGLTAGDSSTGEVEDPGKSTS